MAETKSQKNDTPAAAASPSVPPSVPPSVRMEIKGLQPAESVLFDELIDKVSPKIRIRHTSGALLEAFSNIDVKAEKVGQILYENPYFEAVFMRVIESLGSKRDSILPESAVILLGMQNSRNLILALQLLRSVTGNPPEWTKDGKLAITAADVLKYASKTEEGLSKQKDGYADTAFAAGFVFDVLAQVAQALAQDPKKIAPYIDTIYNHGLKTAQIGTELAKKIPDFSFTKYAFAACLIHDVGKALMAIVDASYLEFVEKCAAKNLPRPMRFFAETRRYGTNHAVIGALCCEYVPVFRPIAKSIQFHHDPYLIQSSRSHWQLASLICLATNIANNFKKTDSTEDPAVAEWKTPELRDFTIDFKTIFQAVAKVP